MKKKNLLAAVDNGGRQAGITDVSEGDADARGGLR